MTLMDLLLLLLVIAAAVAVYFFFVKSRDEGTETPRKAKNLDGVKKKRKSPERGPPFRGAAPVSGHRSRADCQGRQICRP